jgi:hypothetical protein
MSANGFLATFLVFVRFSTLSDISYDAATTSAIESVFLLPFCVIVRHRMVDAVQSGH